MCFTSEEGLWVEKSRQPDNAGQRQVLSPAVQLFTALQHIIIPDTHTEKKSNFFGHCKYSTYSIFLLATTDECLYMYSNV